MPVMYPTRPFPPPPAPENETITRGARPSLIEPSYVINDGVGSFNVVVEHEMAFIVKLLGVIAWAAGWWIVARLM